jgi:AraC-like DNA-binding protein
MEIRADLPVSTPGLKAVRWTSDKLYEGLKDYFAIGRIENGRATFWGSGRAWESTPGCIQIKQPGDVHRDIAREGPTTWTVITLSTTDIARVRDDGRASLPGQLSRGDERAAPFHRLMDAVDAGADRFSLDVALAEAINAFAVLRKPEHTRPVRRATEYLRTQLSQSISLDDLARHADLDKFHLCRAFRAQVGMPPHAYLTHLRIARAKQLLKTGVRASEVAPLVGLYDQAQLTRHFRRIVGTTPARYQVERSERGGVVAGNG